MTEMPSFDRRKFLKVAGATGILSGSAEAVAAQRGDRDELLVGVAPSANAEQTAQRALPSEARIVGKNDTLGYVRAELPDRGSATTTASVASTVASRPGVEYAEPNAVYETLTVPNDPRFGDQYAPEMVNAPAAWDTTFGDGDVTIAVVDQGIKYDHSDLEANVASDHGWDFVDDDDDPYPDSLSEEHHGTHVAGIVAAGTDNEVGIAGISNATLLGVRALDETGLGSTDNIADGIQWATDNGADIVNLSLGGGGFTETLQKAVSYAHEQGVLLVAAAGNDYGGSVSYPAAYGECIAVSALDPDGGLASYSNLGPEIDLAAPGTNVLSTWTDDGFEILSGTSMAAPVVSGIAALVLSEQDISNTELRERLLSTAVDVGLSSAEQGAGRVDTSAVGGELGNTMTIEGTGRRARYLLSSSGRLRTRSGKTTSTDDNDDRWESVAAGLVSDGDRDSYDFSGELVALDLERGATATLNGERVDPDEYLDNVLTIEGSGSVDEYTLATSGTLKRTGANGATIDSNDEQWGSTATGQVGGGGRDSYKFSGALVALDLNGDTTAYLNGKPIDPNDYLNNVLTIEGSDSGAEYTLATSGTLKHTGANDASINSNDDIWGSTASGLVGGGRDSYKFSGALVVLDIVGDATVYLNGERINPDEYLDNVLTIVGTGSRAEYTLTTSGTLKRTGANGATIDSNDSIRDSTATGQVGGGRDSYKFSGELVALDLEGDATAYLNGKRTGTTESMDTGVYSGLSDTNFDTINRMEEWQNTPYSVQNLFVPWNPDEGHMDWLFDQVLPRIWNAGRTPLITWEPYTPGARTASIDTQSLVESNEYDAYLESLADTTPDDIEVRIKNGEYDDYIGRWAHRLQNALAESDGRKAYLRLAHEMNGDWYPWSPTVGDSTPESYVGMWRHVRGQFDRQGFGGDDLQWMWCVNAEDVGSYTAEQLYPGSSYVDWLSLDGYQWGRSQSWSSWQSPHDIYGGMLDRLASLGDKPICVAEFASSSKVSIDYDPQRKGEWIRDALAYFESRGVDMWCWFNEDKETDWAVFDGERGTETVAYNGTQVDAYSAYREVVDAYATATDTTTTASPAVEQAIGDD